MYIHTVTQGETLYHIARKYGTSAVKIAENNGLGDPDKISVGQKLLILTPTRTYTVRGGDTLDGISRRFGVSMRTLLQYNPYLGGKDRTYPEELIALKYDLPSHGTAAVNGYMYRGCSEERLVFAMPYINYLTVAAYRSENGRILRFFDDTAAIHLAKEWNRIPVMRVYEPREVSDIISEKDSYVSRLTSTALGRGYSGIALAAYKAHGDEWEKFLLELKKRMIELGLFLFTEIDANSNAEADSISDAQILCYEKCHLENIPTFEEGENQVYNEYAKKYDSGRMFMDFSPFAYAENKQLCKRDAEELAYRSKREIEYDALRKICFFEYNKFSGYEKKPTSVIFEAPENIKAKLDLIGELGYMGISFDIMRAPTSHIMMMATSFSMGVDYLSSSAET